MGKKKDKIAAKKAAVLRSKKKIPKKLLLTVASAAVLVGGSVFFLTRADLQAPNFASALVNEQSELNYPAAEFDDGTAHFFEHTTDDGVSIRFFVLRSSDGVVRSAFDACDSCWRAHKGYRQDGDEMVCQNCRMRFASVKVMEVKGGCNPSPLPNKVENGQVVIRIEDVEAGRGYFQPVKEG